MMERRPNYKKKFSFCIGMIFLVFCLFGFDSQQQKIYDQADLLTEDEEAELQELLVASAQVLEQDLVIVTIQDNEGKSAKEFSDSFYEEHGFGYDKTSGDGVLLLLDMDGREIYISTAGQAVSYYDDAAVEKTLDRLVPLMQQENYAEVCREFIKETSASITASLPSESTKSVEGGSAEETKAEMSSGESKEKEPESTVEKDTQSHKESESGNEKQEENSGLNPTQIVVYLGIAMIAAWLITKKQMKKVHMPAGNETYLKDGVISYREKTDEYINTTVVIKEKVKNAPPPVYHERRKEDDRYDRQREEDEKRRREDEKRRREEDRRRKEDKRREEQRREEDRRREEEERRRRENRKREEEERERARKNSNLDRGGSGKGFSSGKSGSSGQKHGGSGRSF
ncbi:TPM domain-containing protein [Qiania dongpingensis]|uniref:TPM domain-containing protein n=1 Tax=Qiania dongpingensis TaxID=2763669 RepID=A0A7G9G7F1_9FIRM|nr:TPM domain-containing protein [Qiania dongpingensis]QNM06733.1 TPM domain-containing protein [Qiania dongpingensis]